MSRRWEELEEDCLVTIFEMLTLDDLIRAVPFVCTSWFKASLNPSLWRSLDLRCWDTFESRLTSPPENETVDVAKRQFTNFLKFVVGRSHGSVVSLQFPTNGVSVDDLIYASNECVDLKFLKFSFMPKECYVRLPALVGRWSKLEYLCVIRPPVCLAEILKEIGRCCDNFKGLKVTGWVVSEVVAKIVVAHIPNIKALDLSWSLVLNNNLQVILEGCKQLEELNLMNCESLVLDDQMLSRIRQTTKCFKHELFQWGSFSYMDDKWHLTNMEVGRILRLREVYEMLRFRAMAL